MNKEPYEDKKPCPACDGQGWTMKDCIPSPEGYPLQVQCKKCGGTGEKQDWVKE